MAPFGLRLTHPETEGVRHLTEDGPVETTLDAFPHLRTFTVQLWVDADTDVLTSISPHGDTTLAEFDLDGLTTDEAHRAVGAILWLAVSDPVSLGLVVDSRLPDTAPDWEGFLFDGGRPPSHTPELLWSPSTSSLRLTPGSWLLRENPSPH
ncbi:hypothetical protein ACIBK9_28565 [Nonomuraea sp. NPDC050227]|uniref:hypothetical protein n=1 Tax=unclassified Nonomuraea TaxID=2593643 RepID=UPI0033F6EEA1